MMRAGGLWGLEKWLEETVREEWGCRALFIRTATLGPEALLEHSQNHKAANTEVQFTLFFSCCSRALGISVLLSCIIS